MDNIVSVIVSAILIYQSTTAVEIGSRISPIHETSLHSNNSNASSQYSQLLCPYLHGNNINCRKDEPLLKVGYCATYSDHTKLVSILACPFLPTNSYNYAIPGYILLPKNLSQLNDYMCGPLNRKGLVCSECADGFGPSVTSFGYRCANCTDVTYGVPLFLFIKLIPITILYLIILVFQISVTSPPMPCLIMFSQYILIVFDPIFMMVTDHKQILFTDDWKLRLDIKIIFSLYQLMNLDLVQNSIQTYCISNKLKFIHIAFLGYMSAFYPLLLIFLTWTCVELHSCNFRPLVWLWKPFHRCFVRLRRGWNMKSDIVDVFTTFFFLTYSKILYQTILFIWSKPIKNIDLSGNYFLTYVSRVDHSVEFGGIYHLSFAIPGLLISAIFIILPPLVLILYPTRVFRKCLSKCRLNLVVITIFLDKVYGCYRNGLDGGRDMRSFSGLYFILPYVVYVVSVLIHDFESYLYVSPEFAIGTLFFVIILVITIGKPYRKAYMNHLDTLLLSNFMILCYVLCSGFSTQSIARTLIAIPITVFIIAIVMTRVYNTFRSHLCHKLKLPLCIHISFNYQYFTTNMTNESSQNSTVNTPTSTQPLLQPTSTVTSYGTTDS